MRNSRDFLDHFWSQIDYKTSDCWIWQGTLNNKGYGKIHYDYKYELAHRYMWKLLFKEIPKGLCLCHICDNPKCVNPGHLFLGTQNDNMKDASAKNRLGNKKLSTSSTKLMDIEYKNYL